MYSKIKIFLVSILIITCFLGCEEAPNNMPDVSVNIQIDPASLAQIGIGTAGYCPISGGIKGIIIYHDNDQYYAFDRLCTNYPNDNAAITIDDTKITATCPVCGSQFLLTDGSVLNSPAKYPLKQYQASIVGNRLYISNY
jgi:nitrite reductase/ring-hydroxylating ferredoxin subunit